ncbi:flagellar export chaperone FliS [Paraclostridium bifermentans]|uniref:flagellar export chaperone FliS n=1 Tax=Paraclostridium bifermentans TaxID=1490 RepID=UPI00359C5F80
MYTANPYNTYKQNSVNTASKEQLLLMLVDGAVKYTKIARLAIMEKNMPRAHKELVRVQDIFLELMITMDKSAGKYMEDLYNLYDFIKNELAKANIKKDVKIIDDVLPLIEEVRDMWHEVDRKIKTAR